MWSHRCAVEPENLCYTNIYFIHTQRVVLARGPWVAECNEMTKYNWSHKARTLYPNIWIKSLNITPIIHHYILSAKNHHIRFLLLQLKRNFTLLYMIFLWFQNLHVSTTNNYAIIKPFSPTSFSLLSPLLRPSPTSAMLSAIFDTLSPPELLLRTSSCDCCQGCV